MLILQYIFWCIVIAGTLGFLNNMTSWPGKAGEDLEDWEK